MNRIFLKICMLICLLSMVPTAMATVGGPDDYGYTYDDSVTYDWIDIAHSDNKILSNSDDSSLSVPIGFSFEFYGNILTDIVVSNNGIMADVGIGTYSNPALTAPNTDMIISPYWDDLLTNLNDADAIYYKTIGTSPDRMFVVEWHVNNRYHYDISGIYYGADDPITFEVILYEGSNDIKFQYQDVNFADVNYDNGASATVGIQGSKAILDNYFLQYSYNEPDSLSNNMAILFTTHDYSTHIPEFPTIALPVLSVIGLMFLLQRRKIE